MLSSNLDIKFKTKAGWLTPYALNCGYVERHDVNAVVTELFKYSGCDGYHVRQHDHVKGKRVVWDTHEKLTDARKQYKKLTS